MDLLWKCNSGRTKEKERRKLILDLFSLAQKSKNSPRQRTVIDFVRGNFTIPAAEVRFYWFYLIKPYPGDWETQTMLQIMNVLIFKIHQFGGYTGDAINSVTRLGEFWKFLGQFFLKSTQNIKWLLGLFWKAALLWLTLGQSLET